MRAILNLIVDYLQQGEPIAIGAIIKSTGSAPRSSGARILVRKNGQIHGTIGGGELEGKSIAAAVELLQKEQTHCLLDFNLSTAEAAKVGMVCGGRQQVLVTILQPTPEVVGIFVKLRDDFQQHQRPVLITIVKDHDIPQHILYDMENTTILLPEELRTDLVRKTAKASNPFTMENGSTLLFCEPLVQPKTIHFAGGGHVAQAAAQLASIIGFNVRVFDDRAEFANHQRFPLADQIEVLTGFDNCLGALGPDDMVVIVTRGHYHDREVLREALKSSAGYIGMIGSKTKRDATYNALRQEGFTDSDFAKVHCPIGLDLGGDSPAEIGLSIVAQLQQVRSGRAA
jgi:xanthine dehydrogenase accessory factor